MTDQDTLSVLLSLLSALMFAITFILVKVGGKTSSTLAALWVTLTTNVVFLWGWSLFSTQGNVSVSMEWRYFALAGVFAPLLGRLFQFQGMARLGANITTPLTLTHPVITVALATVFLGESIDQAALAGVCLVLIGSILLGAQSGKGRMDSPTRKPTVYLLLPLAASLSYGVSVIFRKVGIDSGTDAVTAAAVTTTTSWLLFVLFLVLTRTLPRVMYDTGLLAFLLAGVFSSLGPVFLYMALQVGKTTVVAPLASTTPFFVLLVTGLFMREGEILNRWVMLGTATTVFGVGAIVFYGTA